MKFRHYVISYFGEGEVAARRRKIHNDQIEWLRQMPGIEGITVFAQEYKPDDFLKDVQYIINNGDLLWAGVARNKLLMDFYSSDADYALFWDNDAALYNHFQEMNIAKWIDDTENSPRHKLVDMMTPIQPRQEPFWKSYERYKDEIDNGMLFHHKIRLNGSFFILKNIYKYKGIRLFFDENLKVMEDYDFALQMTDAGLGVYLCLNMVLKDLDNPDRDSTIYNKDNRVLENARAMRYIAKKYEDIVFDIKKNRLDLKEFKRNNNKFSKRVYIPRVSLDRFADFF